MDANFYITILNSLLANLFLFLKNFKLPILIIISVFLLYILFQRSKYLKSNYYSETKSKFLKVFLNTGLRGEYETSVYLEKLNGYKKILYNIYLKKNENETTEIDLIMIHESGIYVFESKNYSGWIFGNEKNKNWTQSLNKSTKYKFYNPIWQNKTHVNSLQKALESYNLTNYYSIIVFSVRCTLKKIEVNSPNVRVIKRDELTRCIKKIESESTNKLTIDLINEIYNLLIKYCNASDEIKAKHIQNIKEKYNT